MLTPAAEVAEQAALAVIAWTLIMMELQQTVVRVLLVILLAKCYIGGVAAALVHTCHLAVQATVALEVEEEVAHITVLLKCPATFLGC
jgi:hypothetical protein